MISVLFIGKGDSGIYTYTANIIKKTLSAIADNVLMDIDVFLFSYRKILPLNVNVPLLSDAENESAVSFTQPSILVKVYMGAGATPMLGMMESPLNVPVLISKGISGMVMSISTGIASANFTLYMSRVSLVVCMFLISHIATSLI